MKAIGGRFGDRPSVDRIVDHLVEEYGMVRTDILLSPVSDAPNSGTCIFVSVDVHDDEADAVIAAFRNAGGQDVALQ
ncbi:MAG: hypothetical protein ACSLE1_01135 [Sphingobium sp.]